MIRTKQFSTVVVPREDTGVLPICCPYPLNSFDLALFSVYDRLTHNTVLCLEAKKGEPNMLFVNFDRESTYNMPAGTYYWDVKLYRHPYYNDDEELVNADEIHSLYSAYKLPKFIVTEVPNHG